MGKLPLMHQDCLNATLLFSLNPQNQHSLLLRRMRAKGFKTFITSARGLGDPEVFLLK